MEQISARAALGAPQKGPIVPPAPPTENPTEEPQRTPKDQPVNPEDQKKQDKVDSYVVALMNELHGSETRDDVLEILKNGKDHT